MPIPSPPVAGILLDIEGTTSSISFVHDEMFPFVLEHLDKFLLEHSEESEVSEACDRIAKDAGFTSLQEWHQQEPSASRKELVERQVRELMGRDAKATGLKALQGLIWKSGFHSGELKAHVFPDVIPAIRNWRAADIDVRIYSSGSVTAQKLFFGHLREFGDCLELFSGHYDTTIGNKKEAASYEKISRDWGLPASEILFVSDVPAELYAARESGLQIVGSHRPGNSAVGNSAIGSSADDFPDITWLTSFHEISSWLKLADR